MSVVVDASVAVKWVVEERGSDAAQNLRDEELIAPALWLTEAADALWKISQTGNITGSEAEVFLAELMASPVASVPTEPHLPAALALATELRHPVYGCIYLALAISRNTHVITDDRRFAAAVARSTRLSGRVRLLGA